MRNGWRTGAGTDAGNQAPDEVIRVVLLPGLDGTGDLFAGFTAALGAELVPLVVSYPDDPSLGYSALTESVRVQLPTDQQFVLLGESFSGPVAISLAEAKPAGLVGLVLCCSFARHPLSAFKPLKILLPLLPIHSRLVGLIVPFIFGRFSSLGLRTALRRALDRVSAKTLRARLRAVLDIDCSDKLKNISVPVLYLQATEDRIVPSSAARHIANLMPALQVVPLQGPHLLLQTAPERAAILVNQFVRETLLAADTLAIGDKSQSASSQAGH